MKNRVSVPLALVGFLALAHQARASQVSLQDWCVNLNGDVSTACNGAGSGGTSGSGSIDLSNYDTTLGSASNNLGFVTIQLAAGSGQYALIYADYDVDYTLFGSFDDSGSTSGALPSEVSFSLNDPNLTSGSSLPTGFVLFDQFSNNTLDNTNSVGTPSGPPNNCCDVGFALGFSNIDVPVGGATIVFSVTNTAPASGFYIQQTNQDTLNSIYLQGTLTTVGTPTPEPSPIVLVVMGLVAIAIAKRRGRANHTV